MFQKDNFAEDYENLKTKELSNLEFDECNFTNSNFIYSEQFNINIQNNILDGAKFSRYEATRLLNSLNIELID
jgi:uncharacterized protein YjbI with pentapeptide repeats